jgi:hypothetical protein
VLERIAIKLLSEDECLNLMLSEGRVSYLLVEALDDADISALKDALKKTKGTLETAMKSYKSQGVDLSGIKGISDYYKKLTDALGSIQKTVAEVELEGDPDLNRSIPFMGQEADARQVLRVAAAIQGRASQFIEALGGGVQKVVDALSNIDELDREAPISAQAGQGNIPSEDKIKSAIDSALAQAVPKKGVLAQMMGFFKKQAGLEDKILDNLGEPDLGAFVALLLKHTWTQLNNIAAALNKIPSAAENEVPADVVTSFVNPETTGAPGGAGGEDETATTRSGGARADTQAATQAAETAAKQAEKKPFGAALMDVLKDWSGPYEDDPNMAAELDRFRSGMRDSFKDKRTEMKVSFDDWFEAWYDKLDPEVRAKVEPESIKSITGVFDDVVDDHLKFESRKRSRPLLVEILFPANELVNNKKKPSSEVEDADFSRWAHLAGLEDE